MYCYEIQPTDVVHRSGREWKTHKYISKTMKKGKWVYLYAKNKARGSVTNKNGKTQYSPNIKTQNYYGPVPNANDPDNPWLTKLSWGANILTEPMDGGDISYGYKAFSAVRSKVDQQKLNVAYVNFRKTSDYSQHSQQHRADSSKHYTPESNRGTKSYSPTVKTETYSDGKRRYTEPKDWQTRGSSRKGTTSRKYKKAMNRTRNGINN